MNFFQGQKNRKGVESVLCRVIGGVALDNRRRLQTHPDNTYIKKIKKFRRLLIPPPGNERETQWIGPGIDGEERRRRYWQAAAPVVSETRPSRDAGVFPGPRWIATTTH
ncbi:MAG: hypothetical protein GWM98_20945, partial [Nitrospinaceae bacterium]|nr:hypothetical protein [Nitrospinaceae bacterium]NIR56485.1 hypothetical protein [Nitrospinaceae bacterium]NIS86943.1 hypothetical protein [Nitrospinaceae bacterium]NIT83787.1 hypothetical protein [Nitrospinaceae bacterium]NIU45993.1 hypothetical protein [Nitrospinaceae bacterium]